MIYINSTLGPEQKQAQGGPISSIHYWSYIPKNTDDVIVHADTRMAVRTRWLLKTWDPVVLAQTIRLMKRHSGRIYLVTQPDLIGALPLVAGLFKERYILTWVWMPNELRRWKSGLRHVDSLLALTREAQTCAQSHYPEADIELGLWEIEPDHYQQSIGQEVLWDVALIGRTRRDITNTLRTLEDGFSVVCSARSHPDFSKVHNIDRVHTGVPELLSQSSATLIYFEGPTEEPLGYTNLVEALACGCSVVIPSDTTIPEIVLELPGVFTFKRESREDARATLLTAVTFGRSNISRQRVREACYELLGSQRTAKWIQERFK